MPIDKIETILGSTEGITTIPTDTGFSLRVNQLLDKRIQKRNKTHQIISCSILVANLIIASLIMSGTGVDSSDYTKEQAIMEFSSTYQSQINLDLNEIK